MSMGRVILEKRKVAVAPSPAARGVELTGRKPVTDEPSPSCYC
jgi:hypothetical protein